VPSRKQPRLAEIRRYVEDLGIETIGESHFEELRSRLAPLSERALRTLLRETGYALAAVVEGVRQEDFDQLERTLVNLTGEYERAIGFRDRARRLRRMVITAREHARFAARRARDEAKRHRKEEMAEWMLVWLENPAIFPQWVKLRRAAVPVPCPPDD
jgi:hypothetical protein